MSSSASAEDVVLKGSVTDVFGHRIVMQSETKKYLVNIGPKLDEIGALKSGDVVSVEGDLTKSGEVRAMNMTLADGRKVVVVNDRQSWKEWLLGYNKDDDRTFTAADAKKLATDKGYVLQGEPVADKKHFTATATKDGKTLEIALHRDGRIDEEPVFTAVEAKKLATDKGYTLQGEPVAEKKHFTANATKGGKSYELDLHRDGKIEEKTAFSMDDAKKEIVAKGYDLIGEPQKMKEHYEALARKSSEYFEIHAHRDGVVKEARKIDKTDPKWGAQIP